MLTPGLLLVAGIITPAAPVLNPPRLDRGLELVYRGEIVEASDRVGNRFRKMSDVEVRVLVLETGPRSADCAVLTRIRPREDPVVTDAALAVTGIDLVRHPSPSAVTLEFVRVDSRGRCEVLKPAPGPPPLSLAAAMPPPLVPIDGPQAVELGMFVPFPPMTVTVGDAWDVADSSRPPVLWKASGETVRNGGRCIEVTAIQQSDGWDRPTATPRGWKRTETVLFTPNDGYATSVCRRYERRNGAETAAWTETRYELRSPSRLLGTRYTEARAEAEAGYSFATDPGPARNVLVKIERYLASHPIPTDYREAVEAARRKWLAVARGDAVVPVVAVAPAVAPKIGQPAPDFVSDGFRLSSARGKPVALVFFKPGSSITPAALTMTEALHQSFAGRAVVVGLAVGAPVESTGVTFPVVNGVEVRQRYGVESLPRFVVVDSAGSLTWQFDGFGPEVGYLSRKQLESLIVDGSVRQHP